MSRNILAVLTTPPKQKTDKQDAKLLRWLLMEDRFRGSGCPAAKTATCGNYSGIAINAIAGYCRGNPFFMHLVCQALFKHCVAERRTYISAADFRNGQELLSDSLGQSNFAHLWEDNQTLDREENSRFAAENCLVLCCIATLRGTFANIDAVWERQDTLNVTSNERLSVREISNVVERLRNRKVIGDPDANGKMHIFLLIFSHWLQKHAELSLLPNWRRFVKERSETAVSTGLEVSASAEVFESGFLIPEDELLSLSQRLVYCGKQKDVAEIRRWLRQFDDDNRIEVAFLLLKRLVEKGYFDAGDREYTTAKLVDTVNAMRLRTGTGKWAVVRGRKDNLCISYVDSEIKSGATLARELVKRTNPGKAGDAREVSNWLKTHLTADPILVLVDDFAGTGRTVTNGFKKWRSEVKDEAALDELLKHGRAAFACLYAFGDAIDRLRDAEPRLQLFPQTVLGAEVRAFDVDADVFESSDEREFAKTVMLQIGRELTPQTPLGFNDQAALIAFHNSVPNNTLPIFWSNGRVNERSWIPLFSRA